MKFRPKQFFKLNNIKRFFFKKKFFNLFLFAFCFTCSLYGLERNLQSYFDENGYIISPTLYYPDLVSLPSIIICTYSFISDKKAKTFYPEYYDYVQKNEIKSTVKTSFYSSKLTISQLYKISISFEDFFLACEVLSPELKKQSCLKPFFAKEWMSSNKKCFQFFHNITYNYKPQDLKGHFWFAIRIKSEARKNLGFMLVSRNSTIYPTLSNPAYIVISTSILFTIMFTFTREITRRLEPPFDTQCKNYSYPIYDQNACMNSCIMKELNLRNYSFWPTTMAIDEFDSNLYFKECPICYEFKEQCSNYDCKEQDCVSERYLLQSKFEKYSFVHSQPFTIRMIHNFASEIYIKYRPKQSSEISSIISFISAPISFWVGFAFLNLANLLIDFIQYIYKLIKDFKKTS